MALRVLVVDDSPTVIAVIKVFLMNRRADFADAENGEKALQLMMQGAFDLLISDIHMPVMDGIELTRRVRALGTGQALVPIVLLTGDGDEHLQSEGKAAGANAFVKKPVTAPQLVAVIDQVLGTPA
jgi:CheY-like chemotaxis protein